MNKTHKSYTCIIYLCSKWSNHLQCPGILAASPTNLQVSTQPSYTESVHLMDCAFRTSEKVPSPAQLKSLGDMRGLIIGSQRITAKYSKINIFMQAGSFVGNITIIAGSSIGNGSFGRGWSTPPRPFLDSKRYLCMTASVRKGSTEADLKETC